MRQKKIWINYAVWLVYVLVMSALLNAMVLNQVVRNNDMNDNAIYGIVNSRIGFICSLAAVVLIVFLVVRLTKRIVRKGETVSYLGKDSIQVFIIAVMMIGGFLVRSFSLQESDILRAGESTVYTLARIGGEHLPVSTLPFTSYLYTKLLSNVLFVVGNRAVALIYVQIVLQLLAILFFYGAIYRIVGKAAALCSIAAMVFLPELVVSSAELFPGMLTLLFTGMYLFFVSLLWSKCLQEESKTTIKIFYCLLITPLTVILVFTDVILGGTLILITIFGFFTSRSEENGINRKGLYIGMVLLGNLIGIGLLTEGITLLNRGTLQETLNTCQTLLLSTPVLAAGFTLEGIKAGIMLTIVILFAGTGIVLFAANKNGGEMSFIILFIAIMTEILLFYFKIGFMVLPEVELMLFAHVLFAVLAGLSIESAIRLGLSSPDSQETKEQVPELVEVEVTAENIGQNTNGESGKAATAITPKENQPVAETESKKESQHAAKPVTYIENPLPLPKKHKRQELRYSFEPSERWMKYDVEVSRNDDFDLKE